MNDQVGGVIENSGKYSIIRSDEVLTIGRYGEYSTVRANTGINNHQMWLS